MAWLRQVGRSDARHEDLAIQLRRRGIEHRDSTSPGEPGVVLLGECPSEDLRGVESAGGRALVVLMPGCRADPWSLLDSGVGDVVRMADVAIDDMVGRLERWSTIDRIVESDTVTSLAVGSSACWRAVLRDVVEVAHFTTSPVLLTGETGVGKDVLAQLIHQLDRRPRHGLVVVDCGSIVPSLAGSEFFGHDRGAFTGAQSSRSGAFEQANDGTLFLDEVGELPTDLQSALLRVIQEGSFKRVGGTGWMATTFRLLAATNRDLIAEQARGGFRSDLYHRIAGNTIRVPPLRERPEDIVPLFRHFVASARPGAPAPGLTGVVEEMLLAGEYRGNVRELRQLALRVAARHVGQGPITPGDVPRDDRPARARPSRPSGVADPAPGSAPDWRTDLKGTIGAALTDGIGLKELKELVAEMATEVAMGHAGGPTAAARMLGISRRAVGYRTAGAGRARGDQPADSDASSA